MKELPQGLYVPSQNFLYSGLIVLVVNWRAEDKSEQLDYSLCSSDKQQW